MDTFSIPVLRLFTPMTFVVIAAARFLLDWNTRRLSQNGFLLFIGMAYFSVGIIDLFHTSAYKGIGVFPGYRSNLPTRLCIAWWEVESLALLTTPLSMPTRPRMP